MLCTGTIRRESHSMYDARHTLRHIQHTTAIATQPYQCRILYRVGTFSAGANTRRSGTGYTKRFTSTENISQLPYCVFVYYFTIELMLACLLACLPAWLPTYMPSLVRLFAMAWLLLYHIILPLAYGSSYYYGIMASASKRTLNIFYVSQCTRTHTTGISSTFAFLLISS